MREKLYTLYIRGSVFQYLSLNLNLLFLCRFYQIFNLIFYVNIYYLFDTWTTVVNFEFVQSSFICCYVLYYLVIVFIISLIWRLWILEICLVDRTLKTISQLYFLCPGIDFAGIWFLSCLSVCPWQNINLRHNFLTVRDRDFIFCMHTQLLIPFQTT